MLQFNNPKPRMATESKSKSRNTGRKGERGAEKFNVREMKELNEENYSSDVTKILHHDHLKVLDLFFQYTTLEDDKLKQQVVENILKELYIHSTIEEELVYPQARESSDEEQMEDIMDEADTEHHMTKVLMAELTAMKPNDEHYDAKVTVLGELIRHHVREEEKEMFKRMREYGLDLEELGEEVMQRKAELQNEPVAEGIAQIWKVLKEFKVG